MSDDYECERELFDMAPPMRCEITSQTGVEISQPMARWMLENRRCAIIDLEANEVYSVTPGPAVL